MMSVTDVSTEVVEKINGLADHCAEIELERDALLRKIEAQKAAIDEKYVSKLKSFEENLQEAKQELTDMIESHRSSLIAKK